MGEDDSMYHPEKPFRQETIFARFFLYHAGDEGIVECLCEFIGEFVGEVLAEDDGGVGLLEDYFGEKINKIVAGEGRIDEEGGGEVDVSQMQKRYL